MSLELSLSNLWFYSLQTGILILVGGLLAWISRLREPGGLHLYWRLLLAGCLVLAFQPGIPESSPDPVGVSSLGVTVLTVSPVADAAAGPVIDWRPWLEGLLVVGILLRLIWLGIGFYRLHRLKRRTQRLSLPRHVQVLKKKLGVSAGFRVSAEVSGPITFGFLEPVVVFPQSFTKLDERMQSAVACHELLHVNRRDWVWNTLEELVRTFFWFHPGIHWLIARIQLTREQAVDEQVVTLLGSRNNYLRSLVEIAKRGGGAVLPAPLFLKESQLRRRVRLLLQLREVKMSKMRTNISMAVGSVLLAVTGWWSLTALPLTASPSARLLQAESELQEPVHVGSNVMKSRLVHRVDPQYSVHLTTSRPMGLVILSAVIGKNGEVQQVEVLRGDKLDPDLNIAAVDTVRQWRYEPFHVDGRPIRVRTTVFVRIPPDGIDPGVFGLTNEIGRETERILKESMRLLSVMTRLDPQIISEKQEVRHELERTQKEIKHLMSEAREIDLQMLDKKKAIWREVERVRKEIERVRSELTGATSESQESGTSSGTRSDD